MTRPSVILATVMLLVGVLAASAIAATAAQGGNVQRGRSLALRKCITCHIVAAKQPMPPSAFNAGPSFYDAAKDPNTTRQWLAAFLAIPHPYGRMPQISELTQAQIDDLVSYILSLRGQH